MNKRIIPKETIAYDSANKGLQLKRRESIDDGLNLRGSLGARTRGNVGDIDPLSKVPFKRARSRVRRVRCLPNAT